MAIATAKYWGVMPHILWRYPLRYYRELRDAYIASLKSQARGAASGNEDQSFDWDEESFQGEAV